MFATSRTLNFSLLCFSLSAFDFILMPAARCIQALNLPRQTKHRWNKFREVLIGINLPFLIAFDSEYEPKVREAVGAAARAFAFLRMKGDVSASKKRSPARRRKKEDRISPSMVNMQSRMAMRAWTLTPILRALPSHFVRSRLSSHRHD